MKKIGVLFGMENTFPAALVEHINASQHGGRHRRVRRNQRRATRQAAPYEVIVDRISHDIPFYRAYLKNAALSGAEVINNPFWWSADDKFFNYALAAKLGVAVPPTVLLPHKEHPTAPPSGRCAISLPPQLGCDLRLRRLPRLPEAVRRRWLARRLQDRQPRGILQRLRQTRTLCMTLQAPSTSRNTSAATSSGRSRSTSCPTIRARPITSATCAIRRTIRESCSRASRRTR